MEPTRRPLAIAFYGDDFTGSTDALEALCRAGLETRLFLDPPSEAALASLPPLDAVGVAGLTRSMPADAIEASLRPAFASLRRLGCPHVHYKVCSTFDSSPDVGNIGRAIDVGVATFAPAFVPLLVGAPHLGRYCVFGNLFARLGTAAVGEVFRLDRHPSMSRHPVTPSDESDLRLHLARQTTKRTALFDVLQWNRSDAGARTAFAALLQERPDLVLFDLLDEAQLPRIGALCDAYAAPDHPLFSVGSSAVEMALGASWAARGRFRPRESWPTPERVERLLVVSGSCSPVTARQIAWALEHGFSEVSVDAVKASDSAERERVACRTVTELAAGRSVVVHTNPGRSGPALTREKSEELGRTLGWVAREAFRAAGLRRLVVAGGDTSSHAARALGIEALEMIAPLFPGAPLCRAVAPDSPANGSEVNFKGGQVGSPDYFGVVARGALSHES